MPTCPNGHEVRDSVAFCHECGASVAQPEPEQSDVPFYVSVASVLVIVLGIIAIAWVLTDRGTSRVALAPEAGVSVCGLAPTQRPTTIALSCGGSGAALTNVTWSEWGDRQASGTGTYAAGGTQMAATVVLGAPTPTSTGAQFTLLTVTPSGGQPFRQPLTLYAPGTSFASARIPLGGVLCPGIGAIRLGVLGKHTSCGFADRIRRAYLAAGGHGQALTVSATSAVTHRTYRGIRCSGGTYVVCVGGEADTAQVFFGPFE